MARLDARSIELRRTVLETMIEGGRGHLGSALSIVEILRALYDDVLDFRPDEPDWPERDRCILSKGHGCLALYVVLAEKGFFPREELDRFCHFDGLLGGHPEIKVPGIEATTGALGHGLSIGVGMALAARLQARSSRVFVILGDGEINEGSIWEAAMCASAHRLSNLTAIVDYNKLQSYGPTSEVLELEPLADKWKSFGFHVVEVDGHDVDALRAVFREAKERDDRPTAVVCHTIKGRGIHFIENDPSWHHKSRLEPAVVDALYAALDARDA